MAEAVVDGVDLCEGCALAGDGALVAHDDDEEARGVEASAGFEDAGEEFDEGGVGEVAGLEVGGRGRGRREVVAVDEGVVAVDKDGAAEGSWRIVCRGWRHGRK